MNQNQAHQTANRVFGCIPESLFADPVAFMTAVRAGVPGQWLASVIQSSGLDEGIAKALGVPQKKLEAMCQMENLDARTSEAVLEIARVLWSCFAVWESPSLAKEWLKRDIPALGDESPVSLLDTQEGRRWVMAVLRKIEGGQFS
jgi:putative toxin-antitoxin system antitoxin component (TIGR02293 family)